MTKTVPPLIRMTLIFPFGRDEENGDGDDGGDHTVMFRFGEVHLVVTKSTGQRFAAKTIQARFLSSNHCPLSNTGNVKIRTF